MKAKPAKQAKQSNPEENLTTQQKIRREAIAWFWVILVLLLVNGTVGQARVIPSKSMENTLLVGDHLFMSRIGYDAGIPFTDIHVPLWRTPKRQQIVIFRPVVPGDTSDVIKRVIGLPGDVVDIHDAGVYINGTRLREDYAIGPTDPGEASLRRAGFAGQSNIFPYKVPPNNFFVMGDNRGDSLDSRFVGPIPRDHIIGTPIMIYMSIDSRDSGEGPWGSGAIFDRISAYASALFHPSEIRWRRIFHIF